MHIGQAFPMSKDAQIFTHVAIKSTINSNGQFFSALHNFGKEIIPFKNRGRRIKCQPTALERRRRLAARSSAALGKGRPPSQIKKLHGYKRKRNLAFNVRENRANAKTHGTGH